LVIRQAARYEQQVSVQSNAMAGLSELASNATRPLLYTCDGLDFDLTPRNMRLFLIGGTRADEYERRNDSGDDGIGHDAPPIGLARQLAALTVELLALLLIDANLPSENLMCDKSQRGLFEPEIRRLRTAALT
jgi:hypothetical protein